MVPNFDIGDEVRFIDATLGELNGQVCQAHRDGKGVGVFVNAGPNLNGGVYYLKPDALTLVSKRTGGVRPIK